MNPISQQRQRWLAVVLYAVAMAWVEAAVVYYLRTLVNRLEPYQPNPLPIATGLGEAELVRELATLMMLVTVGWLAGSCTRTRLGYALIGFGVWDIFYYVFLKGMTGWPQSLADWDILFLIPLPWWGPVWAPVSIALLMILWGTATTQFERPAAAHDANVKAIGFATIGVVLALYLFTVDAIRAAPGGLDAIKKVLPAWFNWPLFVVALVLIGKPVFDLMRQIWSHRPAGRSARQSTGPNHHED